MFVAVCGLWVYAYHLEVLCRIGCDHVVVVVVWCLVVISAVVANAVPAVVTAELWTCDRSRKCGGIWAEEVLVLFYPVI